jgi:aconitate hydratase
MLLSPESNPATALIKGPNIKTLPVFEELQDDLQVPVLLKMGDDISTDGILKAGADVLPLRSNIPAISRYAYYAIDPDFYNRVQRSQDSFTGFCVVAGENYAQGSSREHAAIAPRFLGQKFVIAKSYARIGWQNLINFGMIPFEFEHPDDWEKLDQGDVIQLNGLRQLVADRKPVKARIHAKGLEIPLVYHISRRQAEIILKGGVINYVKGK